MMWRCGRISRPSSKEGWNLLLVRETWGQDAWVFYLGYPEHAELKLSADRTMECAASSRPAGPWLARAKRRGGLKLPLDESTRERLPRELGDWRIMPAGRSLQPRARAGMEELRAARCQSTN